MKKIFWFLTVLFVIPATGMSKTHVEIAADNSPAIVAVNVLKNDGTTFTGTGFVVTHDGVIATSRHVTDDALYINVTFNTGTISGQAIPLAQSEEVDLSVIQIGARHLPTVILDDSDYVLPGQEITVIGNPRRLQNTISSGLISQVRKKANGVIWHQISAPISPSSSGSPVFNTDGYVISIAFSSYKGEGNQNLNFSVPSNYLIDLLHSLNIFPPLADHTTPETETPDSWWEKLKNHLAKSWEITSRLFHHNRTK